MNNPSQGNPEQQQKVPIPATVQIRTVFMDEAKQSKAVELAREACANEKMSQSPREIAGHIKNHFDALYGPAWHCIVGRSYGSFVTHGIVTVIIFIQANCFIRKGQLYILLY